uniref:Homing endonuclease LAGLIDADG domain-containing protein n=1 Tax=Stigeoclonium sp. FACHB-2430 TaxID=2725788 RepID=A0A6H1U5C4_9CHLO|nr:hypothetical protein [Stigeoclonium sp. FACHB-2430]
MKAIDKLTDEQKAFIAGFAEGDSCINAQVVRRSDYLLGFQIRVSFTFYQATKRKWFLSYLQKQVGMGTIRDRGDKVSELAIVGAEQVFPLVTALMPFIRMKNRQCFLILAIIKKLPHTKRDREILIETARLADKFEFLNDSKKRTVTAQTIIDEFNKNS